MGVRLDMLAPVLVTGLVNVASGCEVGFEKMGRLLRLLPFNEKAPTELLEIREELVSEGVTATAD